MTGNRQPSPAATRPPARRRRALAGWLALAATGVLAGCGTSTTILPQHTLRLNLDEFRILPQKIVVAPGRLEIYAHNSGVLTHDVVLEHNGSSTPLVTIHTMLPGADGGPIAVYLKPGKYMLVSTISNQADLGMIATLTVLP